MVPHRLAGLAVAALVLTSSLASACPMRQRRRPHPPPEPRSTMVAQPIRVHDGDTFYIGDQKIRLRGIDTPELGEPRALAATRRLSQLLAEGPVRVVPRAEDVYGRIVADVYVRGHDVAAILRREGFDRRGP